MSGDENSPPRRVLEDDATQTGSGASSSAGSSPERARRRNTFDPATTVRQLEAAVDHASLRSSTHHSRTSSQSGHGDESEDVRTFETVDDVAHTPTERGPSVTTMRLTVGTPAAPRDVMLTARPEEVSKRQTERRMRLARQWGVLSPTDISTEPQPPSQQSPPPTSAVAGSEAVHTPPHSVPVYGHMSQYRRKVDWTAPSSTEAKKKKVPSVRLLTVDSVSPIAEGVNTPRSVALCEEKGIDTRQLAPRAESTFYSSAVSRELARVRYESYEKRRQAHLSILLPIYEQRYGRSARVSTADTAGVTKEGGIAGRTPSPARASKGAGRASTTMVVHKAAPTGSRSLLASTWELDKEERAVVQQCDAQEAAPARSAAIRARAASASPQPRPENRGYLSARTAATSMSRATVSPSPAAMRIRCRSAAENRHLTAAEAEVLAEIEYKEHMRQERLNRAHEKKEVVQMAHVEGSIVRERHTEKLVRQRAAMAEKKQHEMYKTTTRRQVEAQQRREALEEERRARLQQKLNEKSARSIVADPYASLVAHRRFSTPVISRAASPRGPHAN